MIRLTLAIFGLISIGSSCLRQSPAAMHAAGSGGSVQCDVLFWWPDPGETIAYPDSRLEEVNVEVARAEINLGVAAVHRFCLAYGEWPQDLSELRAYGEAMRSSDDCILLDELILDPWDVPYKYSLEQSTYRIVSAGPDRQFGTADDIGLPNPDDPHTIRLSTSALCR
jgi:hypothetical protein